MRYRMRCAVTRRGGSSCGTCSLQSGRAARMRHNAKSESSVAHVTAIGARDRRDESSTTRTRSSCFRTACGPIRPENASWSHSRQAGPSTRTGNNYSLLTTHYYLATPVSFFSFNLLSTFKLYSITSVLFDSRAAQRALYCPKSLFHSILNNAQYEKLINLFS